MRQIMDTLASSFKMALQELWKNKLRTFLSLFGVTIGIFCIIGVLATVNSLEYNIQNEIKSLGTNTVYIQKWDISGMGKADYPWWKYQSRPPSRFEEVREIRQRTSSVQHAAFEINTMASVEANGNILNGAIIYGISEEFASIQPVDIEWGRYFTASEFSRPAGAVVIGRDVAEQLFSSAQWALGKTLLVRNKRLQVIGIVKKQGTQILGGWQFDKSLLVVYPLARTLMDEYKADPVILVKGKEGVDSKVLADELTGAMRSIRRLSPRQEDNFSVNDINDFSTMMSQIFVSINMGGWAIAALSLVVGMFGVANIMFVTVKERTPQIGLKKAIGAKSRLILTEFLLESAFLCLIGGLVGLLLVYLLTLVASGMLHFPIFISPGILLIAIGICILVGILAGLIPALQAARMNPVTAIRSS